MLRAAALAALAGLCAAQKPNIACITARCGLTMAECGLDKQCRSAVACLLKCGLSDQACVYQCELTKADAKFDKVMACMTGHKCFTDVPSYPCIKPDKPLNVGLSAVNGSWWIVKGRSKAFDCFDCQHLQWFQDSTTSGSGWVYDAHFEVNTTMSLYAELKVPNVTNPSPGVFHLQYTEHGLTHDEWWYAAAGEETFGPGYQFLLYCGTTEVMNYAGGFMISQKKEPLPTTVEDKLKQVAAAQGLKWSDFCTPGVQNCTD
eukprot:TRINITY_DN1841_c0_g1_i4.p1 TRINITY_DN1841_c0_g1~~TRINITY_DN1841_c0_g1_i4.p1  ORF type:complete len:285 (+),score=121.59 TRINITY_DN1841_c0_g1_i4:76-855(+)